VQEILPTFFKRNPGKPIMLNMLEDVQVFEVAT